MLALQVLSLVSGLVLAMGLEVRRVLWELPVMEQEQEKQVGPQALL